MRQLAAALALALAFVLAGCGGGPPPAPPPPSQQFGVDVLWYRHPEDGATTIRSKAAQVVSYVDDLGANAISISFPFYMSGRHGSRVYVHAATPSPADLAVLVDDATAKGLSVNLRPLLNQNAVGGWRGAIFPGDRQEWFASYEQFLAPYLAMACAHRVTSFTVGAELSSLATDPGWDALDAWVRTRFHGKLSFSNNWDEFAAGRLGGGNVGQQGVDAYFPVPLGDDASVHDLIEALNIWLSAPRRVDLSGILVQETGIAAQPGSYAHPHAWTGSREWDFALQARWYQAMCAVVRERHMAGLYFWDIDFNQNVWRPSPQSDPPLSFIGRQGARAVRTCFADPTGSR